MPGRREPQVRLGGARELTGASWCRVTRSASRYAPAGGGGLIGLAGVLLGFAGSWLLERQRRRDERAAAQAAEFARRVVDVYVSDEDDHRRRELLREIDGYIEQLR